MKKCFVIILILTTMVSLFAPINVVALGINGEKYSLANKKTTTKKSTTQNSDTKSMVESYDQDQSCDSLLGSPSDENSVAWLVQKILNYIQVIGPLLVIVLSSIDFAKVVIQSDDEAMAKATKKLTTRLILAASLFLLPSLVSILLNTFGITSDPTCGLK